MKEIDERTVELSYGEIEELYGMFRAIDAKKKDKLTLCLVKLEEAFRKKMKIFNKLVDDINIELCSVKDNGDISLDAQNQMTFTKDNFKKKMEKMDELRGKTVKITLNKTPDLRRVKTLNATVCSAFDGILWDLPEDFWNEDTTVEGNTSSNGKVKTEDTKTEATA